MLSSIEKDGFPDYGIGFFEIIRYFISKELRFIRREPLDICFPSFNKNYHLFLATVFGSLSEKFNEVIDKKYKEILELKKPSCSISNYSDLLDLKKIFLRRISSLFIEPQQFRSFLHEPCIFYLDATSYLDLIDYWNLRAIGWKIFPFPKQALKLKKPKEAVLNFIERNYFPSRFNPDMYHVTTLLKSRSTSEEELTQFKDSLDIPPERNPEKSKIILQNWYPRIWNEWARKHDGVEHCELKVDSKEYDFPEHQESIVLKTLDPEFMSPLGYGKARFANELEFRFYGGEEILAEVIPEGGERLGRAIGSFGFREWRFSKNGIVYLSKFSDQTIRLSPPKADLMFSEWLKAKGFKIESSASGLIARQMLKKLGGIFYISILANEGVIKLLEKMENGSMKILFEEKSERLQTRKNS